MALTGILQRRNTKAFLDSNPPIEGEIVYATDTHEHGWSDGAGGVTWKNLINMQPILTVTAPPTGLESDLVGTVYLVVTTIVSIAVTPANGIILSVTTPTPVQYLATATYGDGTTSDVSSSVQWTSNDVLVTVSATGLAEYIGSSGHNANVTITATLDGNADSQILSIEGD